MTSLAGKVGLIIGGTSGIGAATVNALIEAGVNVTVAARDLSRGDASIKAAVDARTAEFLKTDVTSDSEVTRLIRQIVRRHGRLDLALDCAGYQGQFHAIQEYPVDDFDRVWDVNVKGLFMSLRHEIAAMLTAGDGSIVNLASIAGIKGVPHSSAYSAAKHAVIGLTRSAALEVADQGIRINALCPGLVDTPMADRLADGTGVSKEAMAAANPMQRLVAPEEVARAALWLFSDATVSVTGQAVSIDGGLSIA